MSVKSLVSDPDFDRLSAQDKQQALAAVDPDFSKVGANEIDQVVAGIRGNQPQADNRSLGVKAWQALQKPSEMSAQGLRMLADYVPQPEPSGNLPLDLIKGAPRIAADTMAEVAPKFINRTSIVGAAAAPVLGAIAPAAKSVLRSIGTQGEELSGIAPKVSGALEAAYKDPTLLFAKGKAAASPMYEAGKAELETGANIFKGMSDPHKIMNAAQEYLAKGGILEPSEALMARKATDLVMKGRVVKDELVPLRDTLDSMAKASPNIASGDAAFQRGIKAQSLRNVFPQNKYGGASAFKLGIMTALEKMGVPGKAAMVAISPAAQGVAATGAGLAARQVLGPLVDSPEMASGLASILSRRKEKSGAR